jgi:hypothetical protein
MNTLDKLIEDLCGIIFTLEEDLRHEVAHRLQDEVVELMKERDVRRAMQSADEEGRT